jgi:hypothetical protein
MRITSVAVDGVGKFGTQTEIAGLGHGVNILAAGNEAGKSTLFRAIRACLFERHNTKNEIIRDLMTDGLSLPITITLGFEHTDQNYTIKKSFVKSPAASLRRDGVEIARGREADEMVWELLGIKPGSGRSVDEAAFGILWVGQGQSLSVPEPTEAATTALNAAIQAEVGTLVGGERARSVLSALKEELSPLITESGRPKVGGPYATASARLDIFQSDLADAELRLSVLDGQLVDLAAKRSERARLSDPSIVGQLTTDLEAARQDLKAGESATVLLSQFEATEQRTKADVERETRQLADLQERAGRIDGDRNRARELCDALTPLIEQDQAAREAIRLARAEMATLDTQAEADEALERELQRIATAVARVAARSDLSRRQTALGALGERLITNAAALGNNRATAPVIASLDKAERELSVLTARLEAAASQVAVELGPTGAGQVLIDEKLLAGNIVQAAIDPLTIRIGDLATITISPPAGAAVSDQETRQRLQARLSTLVRDAGVLSAGELRAARAHRLALEAEAVGLQAELGALGIRDPSPALAIEQIRTEIEEIDALVITTLAQAKLDELPTEDDVTLQQDALRRSREEARRRRPTFDGAVEAQNAVLARVAGARGRLTGTLTEIRNRLDADVAVLADADRARLIAEAETKLRTARNDHGTKAAALEEQRQKAPSNEELERRRIRVIRLEAAIENRNVRLGALDKDIANLEGQIQSAGGDGLGETVETLREERDLARREVEKHKARIATLLLLKETIETCYKEQRDRLHAPLRRHLQPFLNDVFPSAELELGDGFAIAGIKRRGPTAETFERLSAGTQEQIAVLVRLAMGAMICERGQEVPIILDDALVFSDDDRIEQMFDALNRAGRTQQVIVLTCRTRVFAALGGRQLSITSSAA